MLKPRQLARVLKLQEAMGTTGAHYFGHGHEPLDADARKQFHAARLPALPPAQGRDVIYTREFWTTPPVRQPKPEMK